MFKRTMGLVTIMGTAGMMAFAGCGGSESSSGAGGSTGSSGSGATAGSGSTGTGTAAPTCADICGKVTATGCEGATECPPFCAAASPNCRVCLFKSVAICNPVECLALCMGSATTSTGGGTDCTASGMACMFNADCPNGGTCNSATKRCFDPAGMCIGTPCMFDADCATLEKCNSVTMTCVAS